MLRLVSALLSCLVLLEYASAAEQAPPAGTEFRVNNYKRGPQYYPDVAALRNGQFVVVWRHRNRIHGKRYNKKGRQVGEEFLVSRKRIAGHPSVTPLADGGFLVVWEAVTGDRGFGRQFNSRGAPAGNEFRIKPVHRSFMSYPNAAGLRFGGFVVAWSQWVGEVYLQRYGIDGRPLGERQHVTDNDEYNDGEVFTTPPSVTALANGEFVVVWAGGQDRDRGIYGRLYSASGHPASGPFKVSTFTGNRSQRAPEVSALTNGGFVVVWVSRQDGSRAGIFARRFGSKGQPKGDEFQVNTHWKGWQVEPSVAGLNDGGFIVTWLDTSSPTDTIRAQRYGSGGRPKRPEFVVGSQIRDDEKESPAVSGLMGGGYVVVYSATGYGFGDVFGVRYEGRVTVQLPSEILDYPVGSGECTRHSLDEYKVYRDFLDPRYKYGAHPGEDWNRIIPPGRDCNVEKEDKDPVCAIADGRVIYSDDYSGGWGNIIVIKHSQFGVWSQYAHLEVREYGDGTPVEVGDRVVAGQRIGTIGKATWNCAHLHFEVRKKYLPPDNWPNSFDIIAEDYFDPSNISEDVTPEHPGFIEAAQ